MDELQRLKDMVDELEIALDNKTNKKHFKEKRNFYSEALSLLDKTLPNLPNSTHEQNPHYYTK